MPQMAGPLTQFKNGAALRRRARHRLHVYLAVNVGPAATSIDALGRQDTLFFRLSGDGASREPTFMV